MEFVFEVVLQFLGEIFLQLFFELLAELGLHSLKHAARKPRDPVLATIGFAILGVIAGGISLLILPNSLIPGIELRWINLFLTPLAAGGIMMLIGRQRDKRGRALVGLDRFGYAVVFAFAMAVVRFVWAA